MLVYKNTSLENIVEEIDGIVYTEKWKPVPDDNFKRFYQISTFGRLKKNRRDQTKEKIIKPGRSEKGYLRFILRKKSIQKRYYFAHRLVALAFLPSKDGRPCVNHKTGDKLKNHLSQLEWCTVAENNKHAAINGLFIGANGFLSKEQRLYVWDNFLELGRTALAKELNVSEEYIVSVFTYRGRHSEVVSLKKVGAAKKRIPRGKEIVNIETGETLTTAMLAKILNTSKKEIARMINEERKPNGSPYRYSGKYIPIAQP